MTKSQSRSNKAPSTTKRSKPLPTLGVALNWQPPKAPITAQPNDKKRLPDTQ